MTTAIVPGSLQAVATRDGASLAETFVHADAIVLIDVSSSMTEPDARGGQSRYNAACAELARLQRTLPGRVAVISFSDNPAFCPGGLPPQPSGCTNLAAALEFLYVCDGTGQKLVLISDGEPTSPEDATLAAARRFTTPIDCIYVGNERDIYGGHAFLRRLAKLTGGSYQANSVDNLASNIETLLLGDGRAR